jgi:hypothetical protein
MAANFIVPGPTPIACGTGAQKALQFLGFARGGVRISEELLSANVNFDPAGVQMPGDYRMDGKIVTASFLLTYQDEAVFQAVLARYAFVGATAGQIQYGEIGALVLAEGLDIPFLFQATYQAKAAYAAQWAGFRFLHAFVARQWEYPMAAEERVVPLTVIGLAKIDPSNTNPSLLFDHDMSAFPTIPARA